MDDPGDGWFPESVASRYDAGGGRHFDPEEIARTVDVLEGLADGGAVLELAVGTGRLAAPLAARGIAVHGIELSRAMAARIADKPGGELVGVTIGDMTSSRVPGDFGLVVLVFNTINNLTTQEAQVACMRNAAAHLGPGGRFVIEVGVPALRLLPPGQDVVPFATDVGADGSARLGFDRYDVVTQAFWSNHVAVEDGAGRARAIPFRYVWPAELDLMAAMAGMELEHRWADWSRAPFTAESTSHVSVWRVPA